MAQPPHWSMVVDLEKCTGCEACVVACHAENNLWLSTPDIYQQKRAIHWIRIERYWEGEYPNVKIRYLPVLCQHCANAPCEPVCPVYAIHHDAEGLNVQVYNRCIGTRYCANNCPYYIRFFNFWPSEWPDPLPSQLNPDVTVRTRGVMEKCTFCIQRLRRVGRQARAENREIKDGEVTTACAQACPTGALVFGNLRDQSSRVYQLWTSQQGRYRLMEDLGTEPSITYLEKAEPKVNV